jgi:putative flavoprotein involved in K+ transport
MSTIDTVVIGAGHAGLAVSNLLTGVGRDHVVLDRGRVGERWRTERWDSLHLLTPNWMTRLPGREYAGDDPDGYLSSGQLVAHLEDYAASFHAPLVGGTTVEEVRALTRGTSRYLVATDRGTWFARHVVVATGPYGAARVPRGVGRSRVLTSGEYRNPAQLPDGGVLVVGASSSGVQIADELNRAGREVTLAVGRHTRMPRRYRGLDIFWWLETMGRLGRTIDEMPDPAEARRETSLQLVGRAEPGRAALDLDLALLQAQGVRLVGSLAALTGQVAELSGNLDENVRAADAAMDHFLDSVDSYVSRAGLEDEVWPEDRPRPVPVLPTPSRLHLRAERIGTVLLAAGHRPHHPWLRVPVTATDGSIRQYRGVTPAPGVYTVGQRFQHRRDSAMIDGARHDAAAVVNHLVGSSAVPAGSCAEGSSS